MGIERERDKESKRGGETNEESWELFMFLVVLSLKLQLHSITVQIIQ